LRSETSLLQTAGRAARNVHGKVILYADKITESMRKLIETTNYRRAKQDAFNQANSITPETVYKTRDEILQATSIAEVYAKYQVRKEANRPGKAKTDTPVAATREQILQPFREMLQAIPRDDVIDVIKREMESAATNLDYERAIELRDFLKEIDAQNAGQKPK
jgi:excinuclease ABC subunit B